MRSWGSPESPLSSSTHSPSTGDAAKPPNLAQTPPVPACSGDTHGCHLPGPPPSPGQLCQLSLADLSSDFAQISSGGESPQPNLLSILAHTVMVHTGEIWLPETKAEQINSIFLFATFKQQLNSYYLLFQQKQHKASPLPCWQTAPIYYRTRGNGCKVKEERFRLDVRKKLIPQRWSGTSTDGPENHRIF